MGIGYNALELLMHLLIYLRLIDDNVSIQERVTSWEVFRMKLL
jgi:hypothetical protein